MSADLVIHLTSVYFSLFRPLWNNS